MNCYWASLVSQMVKKPQARQETWVLSLGWEDPLGYPHGQRSLAGCNPWGQRQLDTTESLSAAPSMYLYF